MKKGIILIILVILIILGCTEKPATNINTKEQSNIYITKSDDEIWNFRAELKDNCYNYFVDIDDYLSSSYNGKNTDVKINTKYITYYFKPIGYQASEISQELDYLKIGYISRKRIKDIPE